ncbi:transcriptional regulator [Nanoarchaeota archaeon]
MDLPQEIELWHVIPLIRKLLAQNLKQRNLKQKDVAKLLHITEPAVSQYLKEKRAKDCNIQIPAEVQKAITSAADSIIKHKDDPHEPIRQINRLSNLFKEKKLICQIHMKKDTSISKCDICYQ